MAEAVMIVPPRMACKQNIQRCDRLAPRIVAALLKPLGMFVSMESTTCAKAS